MGDADRTARIARPVVARDRTGGDIWGRHDVLCSDPRSLVFAIPGAPDLLDANDHADAHHIHDPGGIRHRVAGLFLWAVCDICLLLALDRADTHFILAFHDVVRRWSSTPTAIAVGSPTLVYSL